MSAAFLVDLEARFTDSRNVEFGKLSDISNVDWTLPEDDPESLADLPSSTERALFTLGAPAWAHREWVGRIYPERTSSADFLYHYARQFGCIELNTTHYRIPTLDQVKRWREQVPPGFLFCPKLPQAMTHSPQGLRDRALLAEWLKAIAEFGRHLGPCFAQFPPHFAYADKAWLFQFLQAWPVEVQLSLEFRHPSWFQNGVILPALRRYLQSRGIGLVITDVAGRRDVLHSSISAPWVFLRFIGNDLHVSDFERAEAWARRLHKWTDRGLRRVFFMVHEPDDLKTPEMADFVTKALNEHANAALVPLQFATLPGFSTNQ